MTETRKGTLSRQHIPVDILEQLNQGLIPSANLTEWLAIDQRLLLENILKYCNRSSYLNAILALLNKLAKTTVVLTCKTIAKGLSDQIKQRKDHELLIILSTHTADMVRCWGAFARIYLCSSPLQEVFEQIKPFADDPHFGVREISWMAIRSHINAHLDESLSILSHWALDDSSYIRRFATESTRPRGVWCEHIKQLKIEPERALHLLNLLKADESRYVQDSVANWLNDAGKHVQISLLHSAVSGKNSPQTKRTVTLLNGPYATYHNAKMSQVVYLRRGYFFIGQQVIYT
ncbi:DNA alkylation repair protein [Sphingobacterium sp. LRF_L2]|uniref:DNA alkylation repair protein n=1 Tax=Sphingobacterium sp. LRF_L2 TaxID=3369421 RepID=UPI003F62D8B1